MQEQIAVPRSVFTNYVHLLRQEDTALKEKLEAQAEEERKMQESGVLFPEMPQTESSLV